MFKFETRLVLNLTARLYLKQNVQVGWIIVNSKEEIIRKASIQVFAREGYYRATTDRIAEEAGVAVGTIYNYFKNKSDILNSIFQEEYQKRKAIFEKLKEKDISPTEKIRQIIEKHFEEVKEQPELIKIILEERQHSCSAFRNRAGLRKFIEDFINEGVKKGVLRDADAEILAMILFGAIESVMREHLAEESLQTKDRGDVFDRSLQEIMYLLQHGLVVEK